MYEYSLICLKPTTIVYTYSVDIASTAAGIVAVALVQVWDVGIQLAMIVDMALHYDNL